MSESKFKRSVMRRHVSTSWTELVKVAESDSITWGARVYSNSYRGFVLIRRSDPSHKRRTEESRGGGSGAAHSTFPRPRHGTSGIVSVNLASARLLPQTNRASVLRWIDLPAPRSMSQNCKASVLRSSPAPTLAGRNL